VNLTLSGCTEWLVLHGWQKLDPIPCEEDGFKFPALNEPHWTLIEWDHDHLLSIQTTDNQKAGLVIQFDPAGALEDICFSHHGQGQVFASVADATAVTTSHLKGLIELQRKAQLLFEQRTEVGLELNQPDLDRLLDGTGLPVVVVTEREEVN